MSLTGSANLTLEGGDLSLGGVLAERAEELTKGLAGNLSGALLVEERKGLAVLCFVSLPAPVVCLRKGYTPALLGADCMLATMTEHRGELTIFTPEERLGSRGYG